MSFRRTLTLAFFVLVTATTSTGIEIRRPSKLDFPGSTAATATAPTAELGSRIEADRGWLKTFTFARANYFPERDIELLARTIYGEVRSQSPEEIQAVVNVIYNRWRLGLWGTTIKDVVLAPKQFSTWNRNDPNWLVVSDKKLGKMPDFLRIREFATFALYARHLGILADNTNGATHYFHPRSMKAVYTRIKGKMVRAPRTPDWAATYICRSQIGDGVFLRKI